MDLIKHTFQLIDSDTENYSSLQQFLDTNTHELFKELLCQKNTKLCINLYKNNIERFGDLKLNMFPNVNQINQKTFKLLLTFYGKEIHCEKYSTVIQDMYQYFECDTWYVLCKYINIQVIESFINNISYVIDVKNFIIYAKSVNSSDYLLNLVKKLQLILTRTVIINYKTMYMFLNKLFEKFDNYFIELRPSVRVYLEMYDFLECVKNQAISEKIGRELPNVYKLSLSLNKYFIKDLVFFITKYL